MYVMMYIYTCIYIHTYTHTDRYTSGIVEKFCHLEHILECVSPIHKSQTMRSMMVDSEPPQIWSPRCAKHSTGIVHTNTLLDLSILQKCGDCCTYIIIRVHWSKHVLSVTQLNKIYLPWEQIMEKMALKCLFVSIQCNMEAKLLLKILCAARTVQTVIFKIQKLVAFWWAF